MGITKGLTVIDGAGVDFNRHYPRILVWSVVVKMYGMLNRQRPQGRIFNFGPV